MEDEEARVVVGRLLVEGTSHLVRLGVTTIGRYLTSTIVIPQRAVSNVHAVLEASAGEAPTLHDAGSANGTKKSGAKLKAHVRHALNSGDHLIFGNVTAIWMAGPPEEEAELSDDLLEQEEEEEGDVLNQVQNLPLPEEEEEEEEEGEENRPPDFVPETPAPAGRPAGKALLPAGGSFFLPESQSSPLPGSVLKQIQVATANGDNKRRAEEGAGPSGAKRPRTDEDDVEIVEAPAVSAEELKRKAKPAGELVEDGVVCIE